MTVPGGQMISMSIDNLLLVFRWSISELPPLKMKGQPERASASSSEKARMDGLFNQCNVVDTYLAGDFGYPFKASTLGIDHGLLCI